MLLSSFDNHLTIYVRIYFLAFFLSVGLFLMPKIGFAFFVAVFWTFVPIFIEDTGVLSSDVFVLF